MIQILHKNVVSLVYTGDACLELLQLSFEAHGLEFRSMFKVHICLLCWYIYEGIMCDIYTKIQTISFKRKLFVIRLT